MNLIRGALLAGQFRNFGNVGVVRQKQAWHIIRDFAQRRCQVYFVLPVVAHTCQAKSTSCIVYYLSIRGQK